MDSQIVVNPSAHHQFGSETNSSFFLVTDAALAESFKIADSHYRHADVVPIRAGGNLGQLMNDLPDGSAVLVAAPGSFVRSTDLAELGDRRVAVMPCGSTPVQPEHIRYFLEVIERTDPVAQAEHADKFFAAVAESSGLRLVDDTQRTECAFDAGSDEYIWNQQAGPLEPGEQQIAPAGELSVLPMEITDFDPSRRLALDGTLTLRGEPIVHAGYDEALDRPQAELYSKLAALRRHPVVIDVEHGLITHCRAGSAAPEGARAAAALNDLLRSDDRYRAVWELGFGINTAMSVVSANCGLNEVFGAANGAVHLGIGLTPFTRFALTFLCPATRLADSAGVTLLGPQSSEPADGTQCRIRRTKEASCGCH
jgi:hypothetical protein